MRWAARILGGLVGLSVLLALAAAVWWAWPRSALAARFGPEDCRRLAIEDAGTGRPVAGVEDIARYGDALFLSAEDRLAAERLAAAGEAVPEGAIYRLPLARLAEPGPIRLASEAEGFSGRLHPHGIDARLAKLVAVNRRWGPDGAEGTEIRVYAIRADRLEALRRLPNPGLCAANDLVLDGLEVHLTLDRAGCPGIAIGEMLPGRAEGRVARMGVSDDASARLRALAGGLAFPNGIVSVSRGGETLVAVGETRRARLRLLALGPGEATEPRGEIALPGGPDNLTLAPEGIVAALHPSLVRLAGYRRGLTGSAPSRIALVDPEGGGVEILYDDPDGRLLSGATVGVLAGGRLVAGSVRDAGLLVCGPPA